MTLMLPNKQASDVFTEDELIVMNEIIKKHSTDLLDSFETLKLPPKIRYELLRQITLLKKLQAKMAVILSLKE